MKKMIEALSTLLTAKGTAFLGFLLAATANATLEVKKNGWKGFWMYIGSIIVAISAGQIIYSFLMVTVPAYALPIGFAAAFVGPSAVKLLWNSFMDAVKV